MEEIKKILHERETKLLKLKEEKEKSLKKAPNGSLRISKHRNKVQYYHRRNPADTNGVYIKEKNMDLAKKLAQKDYDKRILSCAEKEIHVIHECISKYPGNGVEKVYEGLNIERQSLVLPIRKSDEEYIREWQEVQYEGKGFQKDASELYSQKGERVRSKSEMIIADMLNDEGIPYKYECPFYIKEIGTIYPDFTVLKIGERKEMFWEHLGMMDDPVYVEAAIKKIQSYEQNGVFLGERLILTFETKKNPINQKIVKLLINQYLK